MHFWPTNYAIKKSNTILVFIILIVFLGINSYRNLPAEWAPDIQIPILIVTTPYPGATPFDVESTITYKLEQKLNGLDSLEKITSTSTEGASIITLEFDIDFDIDEARSKTREAIDEAKPDLPDDVEDTTITEINTSEFPIMTISLSTQRDIAELSQIADDLGESIEGIEGVLSANRAGGYYKEVQIFLDPFKLQHYQLSTNQIVRAIQQENVNIPGGSLEIGALKYSVRVPAEIEVPEELGNIIITHRSGQPVYIKDVAAVNFGFADVDSRSRTAGEESISLTVVKKSGKNITLMANRIKEQIAEYKKSYPDIDFFIVEDRSIEVKNNIADLENNIYTSVFFVTVVLLLFMGVRIAIFVGLAIPLSMLISFIVISFMGYTLNFIILFALILSLGMLVDNAIVLVENIYRHMQQGKPRLAAVKDGVGEIAFPIISSTATTLAAFFPLLFMPGIVGEFMKFLPITLIITLLSSLGVALLLNSVICSKFMGVSKRAIKGKDADDIRNIEQYKIIRIYKSMLEFCMKYRLSTVFTIIICWIVIMVVYGSQNLGSEFFPTTEPESAYVSINMPFGTTFREADKTVQTVEEKVLDFSNETEVIVSKVGLSRDGSSGPENSEILITFPSWEEWVEKPTKTIGNIRKELNEYAGAKISIEQPQPGPPTGKPINIELSGNNLAVLKELSLQIQRKIENIEGLVNLDDNFDLSKSEIQIKIDREKLANFGINASEVANIVRTALSGTKASTYRIGKDEYDIIVRISGSYRQQISDLSNFNFITTAGESITLDKIASIERHPAFSSIRHVSEDRVITISADAEGVTGANLLNTVRETLENFDLPEGYKIKYTGESEDTEETSQYLGQSFLVAVFLIFIILISQFNSISGPFIILSSVFLSLMGVFLGLIIHQRPFSIVMGGIGTVSLAGIVVNNSIVLLDYINQLRNKNFQTKDAIVYGCMVRFRPVLLTAITTILGLTPVIFGLYINVYNFPEIVKFGSASGTFWEPMAYAVIYGLGISTILTLIVVPVLYSLIESAKSSLFNRKVSTKKTKLLI